jgi:hypothetical protein
MERRLRNSLVWQGLQVGTEIFTLCFLLLQRVNLTNCFGKPRFWCAVSGVLLRPDACP